MPHKVNALGIFGIILSLLGFALLCTSMFTPHWIYNLVGSSSGIITECGKNECFLSVTTQDARILPTIICLILACILNIIGIVVGIVSCFKSTKITLKGAIDIGGGLVVLVANGVFTSMVVLEIRYKNGNPGFSDFGWSFYSCWSSGAVIILAGIIEANGRSTTHQNEEIHPTTMQAHVLYVKTPQARNGTISQAGEYQMALIND
uniref:claudin domain-containing protein 2-like n=1 Tax=Styela clava TaxID=7725 RepID=UPI00193ABD99|nr:claudin domain-containing protein 2-like [Styela clava]